MITKVAFNLGINNHFPLIKDVHYYTATLNHAPLKTPKMIVMNTPRISNAKGPGTLTLGETYSSMITGPKREEVMKTLPPKYKLKEEPSGPCVFEITQYLECAAKHDKLEACKGYKGMVTGCNKHYKLDVILPSQKE